MAPETEETTPEVVETTPEAPPVAPEETGAEPFEVPVSVLAEFRAARKAEREGELVEEEAPSESVAPQADGDSTEEPAVEVENQLLDPDTGEVLDRRTRSAKRIEALLRERKELRQQLVDQNTVSQESVSEPVAEEIPQEPEAPPELSEFAQEKDPYEAFSAATARWHAREEFRKQAELQATADRTAHVEASVQQAQSDWDGKLDEVRKRLPDFDQAYTAMYETLPSDGKQRPLVETLLTSPIGHEMAYYLGKNPKVTHDLYNKPTLKAHIRAIGKLEAQVEMALHAVNNQSASSTPVGTPAPPINPVGGGSTPTTYNSQTASLAQFRKRHGVRGGRRSV